jgi:hypothetical protein
MPADLNGDVCGSPADLTDIFASVPEKEKPMTKILRPTDGQHLTLSPGPSGNGQWQRRAGTEKGPAAVNPFRRRCDWVTLGFRLGGALLGTGGCILGACMPYQDPVGVAISMLWWGIYLGCFGASIGALAALLAQRAPVAPLQGWDDAGKPPAGADLDAPARLTDQLLRPPTRRGDGHQLIVYNYVMPGPHSPS